MAPSDAGAGQGLRGRRGRRADLGHRRQRPLGRRAGSRTDAGGADGDPGPIPRGRRWLAMSFFQSLFPAHREAETEILPSEGRLPPFEGATGWLNSEPLRPEGLHGRVVAVQFWTYTCVNWLRTLPYVREWAKKYHDQGLSVIGVHTPEFGFERNVENVIEAARDMRVDYPIALDSYYAVWGAFANHFWPALYIADGQGRIRYHHFGEGEYAMSEMVVQKTLAEHAAVLEEAPGRIAIRFHARDANLVMGPAERGASVPFRVLIDGEPPGAAHGTDVDEQGNGKVSEQRLYQLIRQPGPIADRLFEIEYLSPVVEAYCFTFG